MRRRRGGLAASPRISFQQPMSGSTDGVIEIQAAQEDGTAQPILRVASGQALRGFDDGDDGHLGDSWTGDAVTAESRAFPVTVRTSRLQSLALPGGVP